MSDTSQERIEDELQSLVSRLHECESALRFYAKHEHWMGVTEDAEARTLLVAAAGKLPMDGWAVAEHVLQKQWTKP